MKARSSKRNSRTATKATAKTTTTAAIATTATSAMADFRPSRKCFSFNGCLFALLLLFTLGAQQASCRPGQYHDLLPPHLNVDEEFRDSDNLEIHHVKLVNGVMKADHPIVMYKEDFVDENYVPAKNFSKPQRKYKDISHRRRHKASSYSSYEEDGAVENFKESKTEKIYFDFVPETPIIVPDEIEKRKKPLMRLVPLSEEIREEEANRDGEDAFNKNELLKRPKKYHRRVRRDTANDEHVVRKRNPFFRQEPHVGNSVQSQAQAHFIYMNLLCYLRHAVAGKKHNGLDIPVTKRPKGDDDGKTPESFDNRIAADEEDQVIFSSGPKTTSRPRVPTRRPDESIFRDPRPENWDFSFMNPQQQTTTTRTPVYTRRPASTRAPESIFRDPSPENYDFSFMQQGQVRPTSPPSAANQSRQPGAPGQQSQPAPISQCVWAIVNCCSNSNSDIRYSCFEQNGCYGAFWGLNPCAESVRDSFVGLVADYYN